MIYLCVNGDKSSAKKIEDFKNRLESLDQVTIKKWRKENSIKNKDLQNAEIPYVFYISPLSYGKRYINNIIRYAADNTKKVIVIMDKYDYNEYGELISFTKAQKNIMDILEFAFNFDDEVFLHSPYGVYCHIQNLLV